MARRLILTALLCLALPASAQAAPVAIDGDPLNIWTDEAGKLQVRFEGATTGEFFNPGADAASAGFHLARYDDSGTPEVRGPLATPFTAVSGPTFEGGSGVAGDPFRLSVQYSIGTAPELLEVTQVIRYVNGQRSFTVVHTIRNPDDTSSEIAIPFRASEAADLYVSGSDSGHGLLLQGPPRQVGGINESAGSLGALVEMTPWSAFEANHWSTIASKIVDANGPGFDGTITPDEVDNGVGVQWDQFRANGLPDGQTTQIGVDWRFVRFSPLTLDPPSADLETGRRHELTVKSETFDNQPAAGRVIRYEVTGANTASGEVTTGDDGSGTFDYLGVHPGTDSITAWIDRDGDAEQDSDEPQRIASVNWRGPPAPEAFESVNVGVVKGRVRVDLPKGESLLTKGGKRVRAARFVTLTQAAQIPVGSKVDTSDGKVRMLSASDTSGGFQAGSFSKGVFKIRQKRSAKPVTELRLRGGNFNSCTRNLGRNSKAVTAARRIRRLRGSGSGRFRTRGRYGSATVRGTVWNMFDQCNGTLTKVKEGEVSMRDFTRDRTVTIEAGEKYLARKNKR